MNEQTKIWYLYLTLFIAGAAVLIVEIVGTRVLAPFYGSTIFVWSSLITVTLGFLALGYFVGGYVADAYPKRKWFYSIIFSAGFLTVLLVKVSAAALLFSNQFGFRWGPLAATFILFSSPLFFYGMVTPFAVRLRSLSVEHTGHVSGTIFAIATTGSVVGAISSGFYLAPSFFVSTIFIATGIIIMALAVLGLFFEGVHIKITLAIVLLGILAVITPSARLPKKENISVIHREPSFYGDIAIVERKGTRCLVVASLGQSCIKPDGKQAAPYGNLIVDLVDSKDERNSALLIGNAGGVIARDLRPYFDTIDVVEIDPKMVTMARRFFGFGDKNETTRIVISDGRWFVRENSQVYDVIIIDAFSGASPVPHLSTKESFEEVKNKLAAGGILVLNSLGYTSGEKAELQRSLLKTLRVVFPHVVALAIQGAAAGEENLDNIMFVAFRENINIPFDEDLLVEYSEEELVAAPLLVDGHNQIDILGLPIFEKAVKGHQLFLGRL